MRNQLSLKIGLLFFVVIVTVEIILFSILYTNLVNDRVNEVMGDLLARGNTHRDVLEENYTSSTLNHVAIMESESDFIVVITDRNGEVVTSSNPMEPKMAAVIEHTDNDQVPDEGVILESDWADEKYVATDSPIIMEGTHRACLHVCRQQPYQRNHQQSHSAIFIHRIGHCHFNHHHGDCAFKSHYTAIGQNEEGHRSVEQRQP